MPIRASAARSPTARSARALAAGVSQRGPRGTHHVDARGGWRVASLCASVGGCDRGDVSRRLAHGAAQHQLVLLQVPQRLAQLLRVHQDVGGELLLLDPAAASERVQNHARHALHLHLRSSTAAVSRAGGADRREA